MRRVLIIDDSLTVRMDLDEVFRAADWTTILCASASAGRGAIKQGAFDCIILDVLLPDANGLDLLRELKSDPATAAIPVILLSARAEVADQIKGMAVGADDYVGKPYDRSYLVSRAEQLAKPVQSQEPSTSSMKILVVEDNPSFANSLREALEQAGYSTVLARTGEEGLHAAAQSKPDAAVIEGMLPGLDGLAVVQQLKGNAALRHIPCLLLMGSWSAREDELRSLEAGVDAFARKEEGLAVVLARLRAMLRPTDSADVPGTPQNFYASKTILAVDDSVTYLHELADELRQDGYHVILAHSGPEALDLLQVHQVDCILLDLVMPGMSGHEVCRRIKASPAWRFIPVVLLTGMEASDAILDGFNAGADDFVPKSSDFAILRARLRAQLRRRQFEEEMQRLLDELRKKDFLVAQATLIRESEQRIQMALQVSRSFAFEWELATDQLVRSDSCGAILGFDAGPSGQESGQQYLQRVHPEDRERLLAVLSGLKPGADTYQIEYRMKKDDGTTAVMEEYARGFFEPDGKLRRLLGVTSDISERKRAEAELRAAKDDLVRANQELESRVQERTAKLQEMVNELEHFSYTITHDMRAPLRAMQGFGDLLLTQCAECLHPQRRDFLRRITESAGRMDCLITDALNYSKVVQKEFELEPVDTGKLLHGMVESYPQFQPPKAEVQIEANMPMVLANEAGLTQCFSNLLGNAVKFVQPGKVAKVRVWAEPRGDLVRLWFKDEGIGIAKPYQEQIFVMFQRLSKDYEGTGIGLALVRKAVERMKGKVGVESEEGKGSRFWIELKRTSRSSHTP